MNRRHVRWMMVMWWAVFFACGALIPAEPRIHFLVLSLMLLLVSAALAGKRPDPHRSRVRTALVMIVATVCMIHAGLARRALDIDAVTVPAAGERRAEDRSAGPVHERFTSMRHRILASLEDGSLSAESRKLIGALLFGERRNVEREVRDAYNYLGIGHILALSGLHLGIITLPIGMLLIGTGLPRLWRDALLLVILALYTALAAFPPSLVRAFALASAVVIYRSTGCRAALLDALVAGGLLIALIDFDTVARPGFQLSFCAVFAIATIGLPASQALRTLLPGGKAGRALGFVCYPVVITVSIQCATLPLVLHLFGRSSLIAPISNLLVMLPVTVLLYAGLAYLAIPVAPVRGILAVPINSLSRLLWQTPRNMAHGAHPAVLAGEIRPALHTAGIVLLAVALRCGRGKRTAPVVIACMCIAASLILARLDGMQEGRRLGEGFELSTVCMGRGGEPACILIRSNVTILFTARGVSQAEAIRTARSLWGTGIRTIDLLILAQRSTERLDGFRLLVRRFDVRGVLLSPYLLERARGRARRAKQKAPEITGVHRGGRVSCGPFTIAVGAPVYPPCGEAVPAGETGLSLRIIRNGSDGTPATVLVHPSPERDKNR